jgi:serine/threonine protein kinase
MPPEVLDKLDYVPASSDIFAAGVILFTLYSGVRPFKRANKEDQSYKMIIDG